MPTVAEQTSFEPKANGKQETENDEGGSLMEGIRTRADLQAAAAEDPEMQDVLSVLDQLFGPGEITDVSKLRLEELSEEEQRQVLDGMPSLIGRAASSERESRQPRPEYGAAEVPTYRIDSEMEPVKLEAKSGNRYSAGAQLGQVLPFEPRLERYVVVEPQRAAGIGGGYPELSIPAPTSEKAQMAIENGVPLGTWQRRQIRKRMLAYLRQENLIAVKADPWTRMEGHPTRSWTIKAVGRDLVEAVADGISEMHYLSALFSGGGFSGYSK